MLLVLTFVGLTLSLNCPQFPINRIDCGFYGITEQECSSKGCNWCPTEDGSPWCYSKDSPQVTSITSIDTSPCPTGIPDSKKSDCGFTGITQAQCLANGCQYCPNDNGAPWCFQVIDEDAPSCPTNTTRRDCGFNGITRKLCVEKGCCFEPTDDGRPWCFYKEDSVKTTATNTLTMTTTTTTTSGVCATAIPAESRVDCGYNGITEGQCLDKGCCWSPVNDGPWCYNGSPTLTVTTTTTAMNSGVCATAIPAESRVDCGNPTTPYWVCLSMGCCWNPIENGPWCYYKPTSTVSSTPVATSYPPSCPSADMATYSRTCGSQGISQGDCESKNCCWMGSLGKCVISGVPKGVNLNLETCPRLDVPYTGNKRIDCGYKGITQSECEVERFGCCWKDDGKGPSCYWKEFCSFKSGDRSYAYSFC